MEHFVYVWENTFNYKGRASRSEYWYFALFNAVVYALLWTLVFANEALAIVPVLYILVSYLPNLSVTARRMHDLNKSGWFQLVAFIPFIGPIWLIILCATKGTEGKNTYGEDPLAKIQH